MDDDHALQCHLELMHALKSQDKGLKTVGAADKPVWIGGSKAGGGAKLTELQAEFIQNSLAMQMRLRPQLERMSEIRAHGLDNDQWREVLRGVRRAQQGEEEKGEEAKGEEETMGAGKRKVRLIYQIERVLSTMPGWKQLQEEVRESDKESLEPVEFQGFYVIK